MNRIQELLLRPPRQTYYSHDLGSQFCYIKGQKVKRTDFNIYNHQNNKLLASFFHFYPDIDICQSARTFQQEKKNFICSQTTAIYLHTHHGSKIEGLYLREPLMQMGMNFCVFDFCGYGNCPREYVTLGINQSQDIGCIIKYLQENFEQSEFVLWGRSMGAVASLLYLSSSKAVQENIVCAIFDSPFSSLQKSILEIASMKTGIPEKIITPFLYLFQKSIKSKLDFSELQLVQKISQIQMAGLFIASKNDRFISYHHSETLYKVYGGKKQLHYIQNDHNQHRSCVQLKSVFEFVSSCLHQKKINLFLDDINISLRALIQSSRAPPTSQPKQQVKPNEVIESAQLKKSHKPSLLKIRALKQKTTSSGS